MLLFLLIVDEFSDDKFKTLWLFMFSIFTLLLRIAGIVELWAAYFPENNIVSANKNRMVFWNVLYFFFFLKLTL